MGNKKKATRVHITEDAFGVFIESKRDTLPRQRHQQERLHPVCPASLDDTIDHQSDKGMISEPMS